jgi:hypothetical protein
LFAAAIGRARSSTRRLRAQVVRTSALALLEPQPARNRVRTMARTMRAHKAGLQAVGIVAVKPDGPGA